MKKRQTDTVIVTNTPKFVVKLRQSKQNINIKHSLKRMRDKLI
jgi:hypothetical protein